MISITIFLAHAQLQKSVNEALNTIRNITQTSIETNLWSFDELLAGCQALVNTFSQNIKYCSVAFSLLFSIA